MSPPLREFLSLTAQSQDKSAAERYREWSRKEIMDNQHGKGSDDGYEMMIAGGVMVVVVAGAVFLSWLRS